MPKTKGKPALISRKLKGLLILSFCLLISGYLFYVSVLAEAIETGQLDSSQTHSGEDLRQSLDLRLAAQASYPSSALNLVRDLGTANGVKTQVVSFGVPADGLTEYALLSLPDSPRPAGGFPAIILCHGYINPSDYATTLGYISDMEFYSKNGYAVIKPDFRGQGLSLEVGRATSAYYSMDYNTDLMSLISSLKDTSYIDRTNLNLWGHSMGAYIALRTSVISKDIKDVILLSGPVGSLKQLFLTYVPPSDENNLYALKVRQAVFSKYGTPGENSSFWKNASPTNYLSASSSTYQIHVGAMDVIVPQALSAELDYDLSALNRTHEYYIYQDGRHSLGLQRSLIWRRSLALLKKD